MPDLYLCPAHIPDLARRELSIIMESLAKKVGVR